MENPTDEDRVGELVGVVQAHYQKYVLFLPIDFSKVYVLRLYNAVLPISIAATVQCKLGSKVRTLRINNQNKDPRYSRNNNVVGSTEAIGTTNEEVVLRINGRGGTEIELLSGVPVGAG